MFDFTPYRDRQMTLSQLSTNLSVTDLRDLTNEMVATIEAIIADCTDEDVVFMPIDPAANDSYSASDEERQIAWTLGHVIAHVTATAEEGAFVATELARGVDRGGRSRYETPWQTVITIAHCRDRLAESRRMRLDLLAAWPDAPHIDIFKTYPGEWGAMLGPINCYTRFMMGLLHEDDHLAQLREMVRQAKAART